MDSVRRRSYRPSMWRGLREGEDERVVALCRELYREDPGPFPVPEEHTRRTLAVFRAEPSRGTAAVLELDGQIVGYALLVSFWSNEYGGEICIVDELFVQPDRRGRGWGTQLLLSIGGPDSAWPRRPVAVDLEVTPQNVRARALYERLGFKPHKNAGMRRRLS